MNTPAHIIMGLAAFSKKDQPKVSLAAALGGFAPDASLYFMVVVSIWLLGIDPQVVFGEMYFSDTWQTVFAIDNSVFVWGAVLGVGLWQRLPWLVAFAGAALLHIAFDFPLHHDDGRAHFWPVSWWVFESPVSYWDRAHGALWVAPLEVLLVLGLAGLVVWRHRSWWMGVFVAVLCAAQVAVGGVWAFIF